MGSKNWIRKRNQIQALVDQLNPEVLVISEANLMPDTPDYESAIHGYKMTFPLSTSINKTARIIMLTKDDLNFKVEESLMETTFSSVWIKLSIPGKKVSSCLWGIQGAPIPGAGIRLVTPTSGTRERDGTSSSSRWRRQV